MSYGNPQCQTLQIGKGSYTHLYGTLYETTVAGTELKHAAPLPENMLDVRSTIYENLIIRNLTEALPLA